jgi:hypothetical protein
MPAAWERKESVIREGKNSICGMVRKDYFSGIQGKEFRQLDNQEAFYHCYRKERNISVELEGKNCDRRINRKGYKKDPLNKGNQGPIKREVYSKENKKFFIEICYK